MLSFLAGLFTWLIPADLRNGDADTRRRARLCVGFTLALMLWSPVFCVIYRALGVPQFSRAILVAGLFGFVALAVLCTTKSIHAAAWVIAAVLFSVVAFCSLFSGGIDSPVLAWFVVVPMATTLLVGYRYGVFWLVSTLVVYIVFSRVDAASLSLMTHLNGRETMLWTTSTSIGIALVVFSLTLIYERLKDDALSTVLGANRAKSEFLTNMSHELRTPLTAILGFTDLLLEESDHQAAERLEKLQTIRRNGTYLMELINDILDLSKIEAGKLTLERLPVSPVRIVDDVLALLRVRADAKGLALNAEYRGDLPASILTDPTRLRQILINLVGNALKFTESGGVTLTVRGLGGPPAMQIQFRVADTGIGMTAEQMSRLFEPFTQADASCTRKFGGTGLGLAISRRLGRMLGGEIRASSVLGTGSVFVVELPAEARVAAQAAGSFPPLPPAPVECAARRPAPDTPSSAGPAGVVPTATERAEATARPVAPGRTSPRPAPSPAPEGTLAGMRLLLAEDGPDNRQLLGMVLRKAGAEVAFAENGRMAVDSALAALAESRPFDVLLMDMQMPVLDGYSATRELRAAGYSLPIVALTAHAMSSDRQKCLDAGCDDYATKPINRPELIEVVARSARACAVT